MWELLPIASIKYLVLTNVAALDALTAVALDLSWGGTCSSHPAWHEPDTRWAAAWHMPDSWLPGARQVLARWQPAAAQQTTTRNGKPHSYAPVPVPQVLLACLRQENVSDQALTTLVWHRDFFLLL